MGIGAPVTQAAAHATTENPRVQPMEDSDAVVPCSQGGPCRVGDQGPGGGTVVYAAPTVQRWGQYLEVAPEGWSGGADPSLTWCDRAVSASTRTGLGEGRENTERLGANCPGSQVAVAVLGYRGGGLADWGVPSRDELRKAYRERGRLSGLQREYWTSSFNPGTIASMMLTASFSRWSFDPSPVNVTVRGVRVRPMRAFTCTQCS